MHAYLCVCEYECSDLVFSVKAFSGKTKSKCQTKRRRRTKKHILFGIICECYFVRTLRLKYYCEYHIYIFGLLSRTAILVCVFGILSIFSFVCKIFLFSFIRTIWHPPRTHRLIDFQQHSTFANVTVVTFPCDFKDSQGYVQVSSRFALSPFMLQLQLQIDLSRRQQSNQNKVKSWKGKNTLIFPLFSTIDKKILRGIVRIKIPFDWFNLVQIVIDVFVFGSIQYFPRIFSSMYALRVQCVIWMAHINLNIVRCFFGQYMLGPSISI